VAIRDTVAAGAAKRRQISLLPVVNGLRTGRLIEHVHAGANSSTAKCLQNCPRMRGTNPELFAARRAGSDMGDTNRTAIAGVQAAGAQVAGAQKVVVINGNTEVLGMLETVLDAGRYDMVFVESRNHAYSQIRKIQPHLVIVCTGIDEPEGFQLLTMLKLDAETRDIPILTYTTEYDGQDFDAAISQLAEDEEELLPTTRPALRMN
jgi:CheY-like chemotaxis protein